MIDLLLPGTDAEVGVQVAAVLIPASSAVVVTWRRSEWRLIAIGATLLVLGCFGLRPLH